MQEQGVDSVAELARRADLTHTTVNDVLNEKTKPGLRFYLGVSKALHVSVDKLLALAGEVPPPINEEDDPLFAQMKQIYRNLNPINRIAWIQIAQILENMQSGGSTNSFEFLSQDFMGNLANVLAQKQREAWDSIFTQIPNEQLLATLQAMYDEALDRNLISEDGSVNTPDAAP